MPKDNSKGSKTLKKNSSLSLSDSLPSIDLPMSEKNGKSQSVAQLGALALRKIVDINIEKTKLKQAADQAMLFNRNHPTSMENYQIYHAGASQLDSMESQDWRNYPNWNRFTNHTIDIPSAPIIRKPGSGTEMLESGKLYNYGGHLMPEYGFGSWLKANAGGLLKGAGSLISAIPGIGTIAGPILNIAGSAVDAGQKNKADKAMASQQQTDINTKLAADKSLAYNNDLGIRSQSLMSKPDVNYGSTFALGGDLMMDQSQGQNMQNPQIINYSDKADKHSEGIGGIPVDIKGNPARTSKMSVVGMTEGGEVTWNGYVFSNKIKFK